MEARIAFLAFGALLALGCQKKYLPSEQYEQAHQLFTKLYATQLDDAFADPQMGAVEKLLNEVSPKSSDSASAQELLRRIAEGRARIQARRAEQRSTLNQALASGSYQRFSDERAPPGAPAAPPDAGAAQPVEGMSLAEFTQRFGGCFRSAEPILVTGRGLMDSWELKDIANCRERHPGFDGLMVLTDGKQVAVNIPKKHIHWDLPDGGQSEQRPREASAR